VSGYLLDTNVAIIALTEPARLPAAVRSAILRGPNVVSVVSYWEVLLKSMKGNLMKVGDPRAWWLARISHSEVD
jgi:PIN domain nuclease of toxin-antitoxin system